METYLITQVGFMQQKDGSMQQKDRASKMSLDGGRWIAYRELHLLLWTSSQRTDKQNPNIYLYMRVRMCE